MEINKKKEILTNNVIMVFLGNITSKMLVFLLMPLLTRYLSKSEFGYYDLIITSAQAFVPILTLQINDSLFRFLLEAKNDLERDYTITNAYLIEVLWFLICMGIVAICIIAGRFFINGIIKSNILLLILAYSFGQACFVLWQQVARGESKFALFAISGVISGVAVIVVTIFLMRFINHNKLFFLVLATLFSFLITIIVMEIHLKVNKSIKLKYIDLSRQKSLIAYSLPLLPNSLSWWILHMANRYIILYFSGAEIVALFSVASKFASGMTIINSIFITAWQESAIREFKSQDSGLFYSAVFSSYMKILFSSVVVFLPIVYLGYDFFVGPEYESARLYIPILFLSSIFISFSSFFGVNYLSTKKTMGALNTTIIGATINILLLIFLYKSIGLLAAACAQLGSGIVLCILRYYDLKKNIQIRIDIKLFLNMIIYTVLSIIVYFSENKLLIGCSLIVSLIVTLTVNKNIILSVCNIINKMIPKSV